MELTDVVRRRRMVRRYSPEPVAPASLERMIAHALRAPSAGFTQGWAFLVLDTPEDVESFWSATTPPEQSAAPGRWLHGMRTAPVVIVPMSSERAYRTRYASADKGAVPPDQQSWPVPYWHVDAGMAALLILQTAVDEGLGACLFGIPEARLDTFRTTFGVPSDYAPVGAITVGHRAEHEAPGGSAVRRTRQDAAEVVHRGRWGG